MQNKIVTK